MVQIKSAYYPERKTKDFNEWIDYVFEMVQKAKGIQNEIENI